MKRDIQRHRSTRHGIFRWAMLHIQSTHQRSACDEYRRHSETTDHRLCKRRISNVDHTRHAFPGRGYLSPTLPPMAIIFKRSPVKHVFCFGMNCLENHRDIRWVIIDHASDDKVFLSILRLNRRPFRHQEFVLLNSVHKDLLYVSTSHASTVNDQALSSN